MAFSTQFEKELNDLFQQRTHWLRNKLGSKTPGKPPEFGRKKVNKGISPLQELASDAFAKKYAKSHFNEFIAKKKNYQVKGRGPEDKKLKFEEWFSRHFTNTKGLIYTFWDGKKKCIYVGRTGSHGSRPSSHFEKYWFHSVKRITIFSVSSRSHVPKLECLAIHYFQPLRNKNKAATRKWTKACPLCKKHKLIETELRDIFRFKK